MNFKNQQCNLFCIQRFFVRQSNSAEVLCTNLLIKIELQDTLEILKRAPVEMMNQVDNDLFSKVISNPIDTNSDQVLIVA